MNFGFAKDPGVFADEKGYYNATASIGDVDTSLSPKGVFAKLLGEAWTNKRSGDNGSVDLAKKRLEKARDLDLSSVSDSDLRGALMAAQDEIGGFISALDKYKEHNKQKAEAQKARNALANVRQKVEEAKAAMEEGDPEKALKKYKLARVNHPDSEKKVVLGVSGDAGTGELIGESTHETSAKVDELFGDDDHALKKWRDFKDKVDSLEGIDMPKMEPSLKKLKEKVSELQKAVSEEEQDTEDEATEVKEAKKMGLDTNTMLWVGGGLIAAYLIYRATK